MFRKEEIGQITDVAKNIVFLIGGNAGTGYANHASQVSRAKRFPWRAGAGLDIQTRNRTRGFATPSDKQRLSIAGPAQGRVARLSAVHRLRLAAIYRN